MNHRYSLIAGLVILGAIYLLGQGSGFGGVVLALILAPLFLLGLVLVGLGIAGFVSKFIQNTSGLQESDLQPSAKTSFIVGIILLLYLLFRFASSSGSLFDASSLNGLVNSLLLFTTLAFIGTGVKKLFENK